MQNVGKVPYAKHDSAYLVVDTVHNEAILLNKKNETIGRIEAKHLDLVIRLKEWSTVHNMRLQIFMSNGAFDCVNVSFLFDCLSISRFRS